MDAVKRRKEIIERLKCADGPVSATTLAKHFSVSRQIIVQDIAIIRASGVEISSLARGYVLQIPKTVKRVFKVYHSDDDVEKELNIIVDAGGTVEDVFIFHKFYGTVKAPMDIRSRLNVRQFMDDITSGKSSLLKNVTSGYHYHTVTAESKEALDLIEKNLNENNFLAPLQEYEPSEIK